MGVDPGLRACGVGLTCARTSELVRAWLVRNPEKVDDGASAWLAMALQVAQELPGDVQVVALYVERQQIRAFSKKGANGEVHTSMITRNPNQILGLAYVVGAILHAVSAPAKQAIYPSEWQGPMQGRKRREDKERVARGQPKLEYGDLVWEALSEEERALAEGAQKSTGHNVLESVGISKWGVARVRRGVI